MKILFDKPEIMSAGKKYILVEDDFIIYIGDEKPEGSYDRVISGINKIVMPGLYNCHTHAAMTLFRGYAEDLPLMEWLNTKIFPAEDLLTEKNVYIASKFAIAEMIKNGIVSFSDMYFFCDETVKAADETGIKANISRALVSFDPEADINNDERFLEAKKLFDDYHNSANERIKMDIAIHAEYTSNLNYVRQVADYAKSVNTNVQVHISETLGEHNECIGRHGITPTEYFLNAGLLDSPVTAAHCVHVSDDDMAILKAKSVTVAHNPVSNLKLGSGVMRLIDMLNRGINVALGTDGCASNNTLDIFKEMYIAAILHKGVNTKPDIIKSRDIIKLGTENGAIAQGRKNCGKIEVGYKADIIMLDTDELNAIPLYDTESIIYGANSSNVCMTMVDGKILYENGIFTTIDIEQLKYDMRDICATTYNAGKQQ